MFVETTACQSWRVFWRHSAEQHTADFLVSSDRGENFSDMNTFHVDPLIAKLKPQSNGPSYSNTVICTLAVDGWAVTFGTARRGLGGLPSPLFDLPNVTAHPSTASVPTSYYSMQHNNCLWSLKGQIPIKIWRHFRPHFPIRRVVVENSFSVIFCWLSSLFVSKLSYIRMSRFHTQFTRVRVDYSQSILDAASNCRQFENLPQWLCGRCLGVYRWTVLRLQSFVVDVRDNDSAAPWSTWKRWRQAAVEEAASPRRRQFYTAPRSSSAGRRRPGDFSKAPEAHHPSQHPHCRRPGTHRPLRRSATRRPLRQKSAAAGCWRAAADVRGDRACDAVDTAADSHRTF